MSAILLATGLAMATAAPAKADIGVIYSTYHPQGAIGNRQYELYLEELGQRTNGFIKVKEALYSAALMKASEHLKGVGQGLADVGYYCTGNHPAELPLSALAEVPYITEKGDAVANAMAELYETYEPLRQEFHRANVEALAWDVSSPTIIGVSREIKSAADLKGLKVRAYGEVGSIVGKGGGMVAVNMAATEVLTSLQTGVVDGYTGVPMWLPNAFNWLQETKTVISPGIGTYYTCGLVMNLDVFNKLPDEVKATIAEMRKEHAAKAAKMVMDADKEATDKARELGISFYQFTPEEVAAWKSAAGYEDVAAYWIGSRKNLAPNSEEFLGKFIEKVRELEPHALYKQSIDLD
jgi:TRAP-type C4-dicarboxylate transport system substrate-binding protein